MSQNRNTSSPTLILHAENDDTIPHSHSASLFSSIHAKSPASTVRETTYPGWGTVRSFFRDSDDGRAASEVVWWEGLQGGHNSLGWAEGTLDLIARVARL